MDWSPMILPGLDQSESEKYVMYQTMYFEYVMYVRIFNLYKFYVSCVYNIIECLVYGEM